MTPDVTLDAVHPGDVALLILPGGDTWLDTAHDPVLAKAADFLEAGMPDERPHTSNNLAALQAICHGYSGAAHFVDEPVECDGDLITASGLAPLEFARAASTASASSRRPPSTPGSGCTRCAKRALTST